MGEPENPGLLPRFCQDLHQEMAQFLRDGTATIEVSFYEIYKEKVWNKL